MKLLQILPSTIRGGAEEYALSIATAAVYKKWNVHVAFPEREGAARLVEDFSRAGAVYHPLEIPPGRFSRTSLFLHAIRTLILLLRIKPDVVHITLPSHDQCLGSMAACALIGVPTAVVFQLVHESLTVEEKDAKFYRWAKERGQRWIAISDNNRHILSRCFDIPANDIIVIYNGPCFGLATDARASARQELRKEIGVAETDMVILTVGRLAMQKGHFHIIQAIPHVLKEFPDARFVWVGEGELRNELEALLVEYGVRDKVTLLGYRTDIPKLMQASDLFLFPTLFEGGTSIALVEAMLFGLPIVSSNASGIPEVIQKEVHGVLFRKGDSCSLLEALRWALDHPESMRQMAANACLRVADFSREEMTDKTLGVLQELAGRK